MGIVSASPIPHPNRNNTFTVYEFVKCQLKLKATNIEFEMNRVLYNELFEYVNLNRTHICLRYAMNAIVNKSTLTRNV